MAYRDRLAASRAQRTQNIPLDNLSHSPTIPAPALTQPTTPPSASSANFLELNDFLSEDGLIQQAITDLKQTILKLASARAQSLNSIGDTTEEDNTRIEALNNEARRILQDTKERIQRLGDAPSKPQDLNLRRNRISLLRARFVEVIQDFQNEERESRTRARQRVERQLKIVKPDATPAEIAAVFNEGNQQIFAEALTTSTRYGESRAAFREVQERQQDLRRLEQTLAELAQLFFDMGTLVEQQDAQITAIETTAQEVTTHTNVGLNETEKAVKHARSYRRSRWICFIIFLIVVIVLGLGLGLHFGLKK
ncbi:t-SNARE [Panaeolus papilionaceus]|nr:t-SNARE [Panaeolus papilionaceus]